MRAWQGKRALTIVSAAMTRDGLATFALNTVEVTHEEAENGTHFYLVEADLLQAGLEEPYVHFAEEEGPAFLHSAVREYLAGQPDDPLSDTPIIAFVREDR